VPSRCDPPRPHYVFGARRRIAPATSRMVSRHVGQWRSPFSLRRTNDKNTADGSVSNANRALIKMALMRAMRGRFVAGLERSFTPSPYEGVIDVRDDAWREATLV
jgi:hypothetical protein